MYKVLAEGPLNLNLETTNSGDVNKGFRLVTLIVISAMGGSIDIQHSNLVFRRSQASATQFTTLHPSHSATSIRLIGFLLSAIYTDLGHIR